MTSKAVPDLLDLDLVASDPGRDVCTAVADELPTRLHVIGAPAWNRTAPVTESARIHAENQSYLLGGQELQDVGGALVWGGGVSVHTRILSVVQETTKVSGAPSSSSQPAKPKNSRLGRPKLAIGEQGKVSTRAFSREVWTASSAKFRGTDGALHSLIGTGHSASDARDALGKKLAKRGVDPDIKVGVKKSIHTGHTAITRLRGSNGKITRVTAEADTSERAKAALLAKLATRRSAKPAAEMAFPDYAVKWVAGRKGKSATKVSYREAIERYIKPAFSQVTVAEMTLEGAQDFLDEVSLKTVSGGRICSTILRSTLKVAILRGLTPSFHVELLHGPEKTSHEKSAQDIDALSVAEYGRLRKLLVEYDEGRPASGPPRKGWLTLAADLMVSCGLRPGEALALLRQDVLGPDSPRIVIHATMAKADREPTVAEVSARRRAGSPNPDRPVVFIIRQDDTKSASGRRTLPISPRTYERLVALGRETDQPIFMARGGKPMQPSNFNRIWRLARGTGEFKATPPKVLRASTATLIAETLGEGGMELASQVLGHSSPAITRAFYAQRPKLAPDVSELTQIFTAE